MKARKKLVERAEFERLSLQRDAAVFALAQLERTSKAIQPAGFRRDIDDLEAAQIAARHVLDSIGRGESGL